MNENKTNINCEKPIYINIPLTHWKYWIFDIEILHVFIKNKINRRKHKWLKEFLQEITQIVK